MQNIHPMIVHFPIALTIIAVLFDVAGLWRKNEQWHVVAKWNWITAFVMSLVALATGLYAEDGVPLNGESHPIMMVHKRLAIGFIVLLGMLTLWRIRIKSIYPEKKSWLYTIGICIAGALISITGHWGGRLVFEHGIGTDVVYSDYGRHSSDDNHEHASAEAIPAYKELVEQGKCIVMPEEDVDPEISFLYKGENFQFCCKKCKRKFTEDPEKYLR